MAEFKRGRRSEAQAAFIQSEAAFARENPRDSPIPGYFKNWIIERHAREEAANLLGHSLDPPATTAG